MSSTNKTANYQLSQFVGTDIPSYLNDYNGDMRKIDSAIHDASVAGGDNASAIAELQSTVERHTTEIGGITSNVSTLSSKVLGVEAKIPNEASVDNKLATKADIEADKFNKTYTQLSAFITSHYASNSAMFSAIREAIAEIKAEYGAFAYGTLALEIYSLNYNDSHPDINLNKNKVMNTILRGDTADMFSGINTSLGSQNVITFNLLQPEVQLWCVSTDFNGNVTNNIIAGSTFDTQVSSLAIRLLQLS